jgi:two-component system KDP operon response regulator KdpE
VSDPARILVVEDEAHVRRFLRAGLAAHGHVVDEADNGELAIRLATEHPPDVVLVDLGLPGIDGFEVVRRLREWSAAPIIVLSARGQEEEKVRALDAGADDYLTKPFGFPELLARIRAALRRTAIAAAAEKAPSSVLEIGPLRIDFAQRRVFRDGAEVKLTPIEYRLLVTLAKHAGKVVTHRQLLEAVWGPESAGDNHYLRVYMAHLRRKLEPDPMRPRLFLTEAGVGYRLRRE